jgi:hypothetical protein
MNILPSTMQRLSDSLSTSSKLPSSLNELPRSSLTPIMPTSSFIYKGVLGTLLYVLCLMMLKVLFVKLSMKYANKSLRIQSYALIRLIHILQNTHDHPLSGHFGQNRTLELIRCEYIWPSIRTYVKDYVKSCTTCARAKVPRHKPFGLSKQLPIPERPWNSISMDFIEQFLDSSSYIAILVIIDHLSKQAIFVPTHDTITSPDLTRLFLLHVFSKHRIPSHVTSDRGTEFVSHFFCSLGKALDMILHSTSRYHLEGDGQMEQANQTLEQYLCIYCNYCMWCTTC